MCRRNRHRRIERMRRILVFSFAFLFLNSCGSFHYQKSIDLGDGRIAEVFFETDKTASGEEILLVEYTNAGFVRKEAQVESDVLKIWEAVQREAEKRNIEEAVIKYRYQTGEVNGEGKKIYEGLLFTADQTETRKWSVRKVK